MAASDQYDADRVRICLEKAGFGDRLSRMPGGINATLYRDIDEEGIEIPYQQMTVHARGEG